ncbi:Nif3-like dinuclear metal center hexameric protein [Cryobacterium zongtaii]|uniref:GTP cyclohydrolase 1 type 2 homolog n=1 Tax=Cryobacterium zongtaii TaxID=1259217 RepID=A0A2S3ZI93_9MICO|nr:MULTISPECIES: Nif3-like dinuclear metal center hexameric protein [Cryobacterium]ASD22082.1 Nif3-like dinuclear metal center hexameric protein [Cryobacterium sp. LW097]POH67294.1 Nif3-like dinuclear metal center hexameric protein [Cryobacterium zongtaii]TFC53343.1 Nif3-like dinuclear metal center hexameric protein [Cryobacterium sp. TMB3-1-2]TFC62082.1 Nif3-like dinuclear metal center hexameric protein [Cryobacterium sp. TMB1-7]TFC72686.1 Nif3-like dinuclear metal center hexameric protein [C
MSFSLAEVARVSHELWPLSGAEEWDAPGLISGDPARRVDSILLAVDVVSETVAEAITSGADLLLAHHPLLLRGVTSVAEDRYKGALLARLIRADCGLLAAHTNADVVEDGVSDVIASSLGLVDTRPITGGLVPGTGIGRVGRLPEPTTLGLLARRLAALIPPTATGVRVAGGYADTIQTVALCGGAGDSLLREPAVRSADVFITSDLRHHPASESREQSILAGVGPALIDVSHWASEWLWLDVAASALRQRLPGIRIEVSDVRTDPWDFAVTQ